MDTLYRILYAAHAKGSHHKIALRALTMLRGDEGRLWSRFYLSEAKALMAGSKAPDDTFKDFTNHVLHVGDGDWGGAPNKVVEWYGKLVDALKAGSAAETAYAAGVLSHYYSDPLMPFHTGSSDAESTVHRAVEWSISKSFEEIWTMAPDVSLQLLRGFDPLGEDWVKPMVRAGAVESHARYWDLIAQYDFDIGVKKPEQGLSEDAKRFIAPLLAQAAAGTAYLLERAALDADVAPPRVNLTLQTVVAGLNMPIAWVTKRMADAADRKIVEEIHAELVETGRVEETLPEESKTVRAELQKHRESRKRPGRDRAERTVGPKEWRSPASSPASAGGQARQAQQRLRVAFSDSSGESGVPRIAKSAPPPASASTAASVIPAASQPSAPAAPEDAPAVERQSPRPSLSPSADVERAPSIGPKTAARLSDVGVRTVADLLAASPQALAASLARRSGSNWITADRVATWRDQAMLLTRLPGLKATEAVLLVASGHRTIAEVADVDPGALHERLAATAETDEMRRALYEPKAPSRQRVEDLIQLAKTLDVAAA